MPQLITSNFNSLLRSRSRCSSIINYKTVVRYGLVSWKLWKLMFLLDILYSVTQLYGSN